MADAHDWMNTTGRYRWPPAYGGVADSVNYR
jgi:hypothetical protein